MRNSLVKIMSLNEGKYEEKCQICETTESLVDTWMEEFRHLQGKLESLIDSQANHSNWLRFMCIFCREKLNDLWEFKILCNQAFRKFLGCDLMANDVKEDSNDMIPEIEIDDDRKSISALEIIFIPDQVTSHDIGVDIPTSQVITESQTKKDSSCKQEKPERAKRKRRWKPNTEPVTCEFCNKTYPKNNLRQHMNNVHLKITPYLCNVCGRRFATRYRMEQHEEVHIKDRPRLPCDMCKKTFTRASNLSRHVTEVHEDPSKRRICKQRPRCKYCCRTFDGKKEYQEHMKSHPGVRTRRTGLDLKCRYCPKQFKAYASVQNHERIHTGEKPYKCEICAKTFRQEQHLSSHMHVHTGPKRFPCEFCDKVFTQDSSRKIHIRIHTGETPFECSSCSKRFYERKMWKNHSMKCLQRTTVSQ